MKNKALQCLYKLAECLNEERLIAIFFWMAFFFFVMACGIVAAD
jgi:hypothetical protein